MATFFDFNGVLVDDEHLHFSCFNEVLSAYNIEISQRQYDETLLGFDDRGVFDALLPSAERSLREATIASLIRTKAAVYMARAAADLSFFAGAREALAAAAQRGPVVVVSGALRAEIELALSLLDASASVAHIVAAEDVHRCKPDPEGYLLALGWLRATAPEVPRSAVLVIEDSLAGVDAAHAASLGVWAVAHSYPEEQLRAHHPKKIFATLAELVGSLATRSA
ncbi:MAG: HAD family phosphatase [Deltaproteobacteria bacterium]|nr:HAD family phosphatase [Deltaproteobacteria bacterium]